MKRKFFTLTSKVILAATLAFGGTVTSLAISNTATAAPVKKDYENHPEKANIQWALDNKFMYLNADGTFRPDTTISQSQLIAGLSAMMGLKDKAPVPEIPVGHWAKDAYEKAKKAGILNGVTIDSNKLLQKGEVAIITLNIYTSMWGKKLDGYTNVGMLVNTGWMKPFLPGPKYNETVLFTRADTAAILKAIHTDKIGIATAEKYALEFHKSLSIKNGVLTMKVPKEYVEGNLMLGVQLLTQDNKLEQAPYGKTYSIKLSSYKKIGFSAIGDKSRSYASYLYELPKIERIDVRKRK
ncbi:S-layer homology domain-containing protein [Brevibacillus sp. SYSU BS000544]|uniref:S-layer homology domain-containing protein n=1 Tax=Brevibacillus sp. SYSU BS000544 TaxID=3416443 RepID=UPI003CE532A1